MKKGDLRTALQVKVVEAKCKGIIKNGKEKIMFNTNLAKMPISVLQKILSDTDSG